MPYRKSVEWPEPVRAALCEDLRFVQNVARQAEEALRVRVYLAVEQGLTTQEVADALEISQSAVSNYRRQGEEAFRRRRSVE
ncbi:helix-turn-helix domain-containing protein [Streptomyces sp. NPDC005227]|uniref:helix-turn-helix domain-containing protein n=1 Tax=Streptomyces sp. NPDC005227 TaxID=3364707 RepID=UPI0036ADE35E